MAEPDVVIVMGVSGTGKTTVAKRIAHAMGWQFAEGDDFHSAANVAKMASGRPLTDEDRWPWLESIGEWITAQVAAGESAVVTCSALRRAYRDVLRRDRPQVRFLHLTVPMDLLEARMNRRAGHFMPTSLLGSQLATLEGLEPDEPGVDVPNTGTPEQVVAASLAALGLPRPQTEVGRTH
jgi:gluconokinase